MSVRFFNSLNEVGNVVLLSQIKSADLARSSLKIIVVKYAVHTLHNTVYLYIHLHVYASY